MKQIEITKFLERYVLHAIQYGDVVMCQRQRVKGSRDIRNVPRIVVSLPLKSVDR